MQKRYITVRNIFHDSIFNQSLIYSDFSSNVAFIFKITTELSGIILKKGDIETQYTFIPKTNPATLNELDGIVPTEISIDNFNVVNITRYILKTINHTGTDLTINSNCSNFIYTFTKPGDSSRYCLVYAINNSGIIDRTIGAGNTMRLVYNGLDLNTFSLEECEIQARLNGNVLCDTIYSNLYTVSSISNL
jgi:hypothetical protein